MLLTSKLDIFLSCLTKPDGRPASLRTRMTYRQAIMGFANYLLRKGKLESNLLLRSTKPEGHAVLKRGVLTLDDLARLLEVARPRFMR